MVPLRSQLLQSKIVWRYLACCAYLHTGVARYFSRKKNLLIVVLHICRYKPKTARHNLGLKHLQNIALLLLIEQ